MDDNFISEFESLIDDVKKTDNPLSVKKRLSFDNSSLEEKRVDEITEFAMRFIDDNPTIIYCMSDNMFYQYDSGVYRKLQEVQIHRKILESPVIPHAAQIGLAKRKNIVENLKHIQHYSVEDFNQNNLMNFKNCMLDLGTLQTFPHNHEYMSTIQLPYNYNKEAKCPIWEQTIKTILETDTRIAILQEFFGYCLMKTTKHEKAMFIIGEAQTGKSTILEMLEFFLGSENTSKLTINEMKDQQFTGQLITSYCNIIHELEKDLKGYEEALAKLVSGQPISVNTKYEKTFSIRPFCKHAICGNTMARIGDTSQKIYRRLLIFFLRNQISDIVKDVDLKDKLKEEASGVFNWAIEGYHRLIKNNKFTFDKSMVEDIEYLEESNNPTLQFIKEMITYRPENKNLYITKDDLYNKYNIFCKDNGLKSHYSKRNFIAEFKKVFKNALAEERISLSGEQTRVFIGIKWASMADDMVIEDVKWGD